jgi:hypothetical protein
LNPYNPPDRTRINLEKISLDPREDRKRIKGTLDKHRELLSSNFLEAID